MKKRHKMLMQLIYGDKNGKKVNRNIKKYTIKLE